jgi:hypothetical protein
LKESKDKKYKTKNKIFKKKKRKKEKEKDFTCRNIRLKRIPTGTPLGGSRLRELPFSGNTK